MLQNLKKMRKQEEQKSKKTETLRALFQIKKCKTISRFCFKSEFLNEQQKGIPITLPVSYIKNLEKKKKFN